MGCDHGFGKARAEKINARHARACLCELCFRDRLARTLAEFPPEAFPVVAVREKSARGWTHGI